MHARHQFPGSILVLGVGHNLDRVALAIHRHQAADSSSFVLMQEANALAFVHMLRAQLKQLRLLQELTHVQMSLSLRRCSGRRAAIGLSNPKPMELREMEKGILERLKKAEAEVCALRQVLFSHILAVSTVDMDLAKTTLEIADSQIDPAVAQGRGLEAVLLKGMLDHLRAAIGPGAANDA
ncbi:MAG: hypothetical protein KGJ57_18375 [Sphingomonadales bacterium]|nr:hypothetical protein [Sphingomonadales bacterium]MDE2171366.1 hypothetical protein [Sphingomonadales bacterium]